MAMMAFSPASGLWQKTTCSWPEVSRVSKIMGGSGARVGPARACLLGG